MNFDHPKNQIIITGMSFSGKSTLWLKLMRESRARYKIVFDADWEVHQKLNWPRAVTVQQMEYYVYHQQPVCFDPSEMFPGNRPEGFDFFCRWIMAVGKVLRGVKLVCVDELRKVQRPGIGGVPLKFLEMADSGRKDEIDLLLVAHSLSQVHADVRMHMSEIITFRHSDPKALATLQEHGFNPDEVAALPTPGGYIRRNILTGKQTCFTPSQSNAPDSTRKANRPKAVKS